MRNRDKSVAIIVPSIVFVVLYLTLSIVFDYATHRNHIPIKEKIISWQKDSIHISSATPVRKVDFVKEAED
jgi:hypothetical protein